MYGLELYSVLICIPSHTESQTVPCFKSHTLYLIQKEILPNFKFYLLNPLQHTEVLTDNDMCYKCAIVLHLAVNYHHFILAFKEASVIQQHGLNTGSAWTHILSQHQFEVCEIPAIKSLKYIHLDQLNETLIFSCVMDFRFARL